MMFTKNKTNSPRIVPIVTKSKIKLFPLSNGAALRYKLPGERGGTQNWFRTADTEKMRSWSSSRKLGCLLLGLWTSRTSMYVVCADFDRCPEGYADFDSLYSFACWRFVPVHQAIVTRSFSGKVKIFFVFELPARMEMTTEIALESLQRQLPSNVFEAIDRCHAALSLTFLTPAMTEALSIGLRHVKSHLAVLPDQGPDYTCDNVAPATPATKPLRRYDGPLPPELIQALPKMEASSKAAYKDYLRILLATKSLVGLGFDLPTTKLAQEVGAARTTVSYWRKQMVKAGLLVKIGDYKPKAKADRFLAGGALADAIRTIHGALVPYKDRPLPSTFCDHQWNEGLYRIAHRFIHRPGEWMAYVLSLKGIRDKPDRVRMAKYAIACAIREAMRHKLAS